MKTKYLLLKRFSGTKLVSGMLASLLALSLTAVSAAVAAPFAYVSNFTSPGTVSVIDGATGTVVTSIAVGNSPSGVAVNPAGTRAYVANKDDGTVSVIDVSSNTVLPAPEGTIAVGADPWGVAVSADNATVYVTLGSGGVAVIDVATRNVTTIPGVGVVLNGIVVVGSRLYVTDGSAGNVLAIDGTTVTPISLGLNASPMGIVASPTGHRVYVVHLVQDPSGPFNLMVASIDTASNSIVPTEAVLVEGDTMAEPGGIAVSRDGTLLYVANSGQNQVAVVDTTPGAVCQVPGQTAPCVVRTVGVGADPIGVSTHSAGTHVFVGGLGRTVSVIGTTSTAVCAVAGQTPPCVVRTVPLGSATFVFGAFATDGPPPPPTQFELTLMTDGAGAITADRAPVAGTAMYDAGTVVNLTATPAAGSQFSNWSEDCSGPGACQVRMDGPKRVRAIFTVVPPPTDPPPTTCDDKIKDLQKKVAGYKRGWWHKYDLRMALRMYSEAMAKLDKAKAKVGALDRRYVHAQKELDNGKAALCADRYRRAHHEFWEAYEIAQRILRQSHYRR
jgi:YVTN family beta-propeller protein